MAPITVKDIHQGDFVRAFAAFLKRSGKLKVPEWIDCVKTAKFKELAPFDEDWFYTRTASIARHLYMRYPSGTKTMTKIYGGRQRRGVVPAHWSRSSAGIVRKSLQALERLKLVKKRRGKGRLLTKVGRRDMDRIAIQVKIRRRKLLQQRRLKRQKL